MYSVQSECGFGREKEKEKSEANITLYVKVWLFNFKSENYVKLFILKMYNYCNFIKESVVYAECWALCALCACFFFYRFPYFVVAFNDSDINYYVCMYNVCYFFVFLFFRPIIMWLGVSANQDGR